MTEDRSQKIEEKEDKTKYSHQTLRLEPCTLSLPIIAMTTHAMSGDEQKSMDAGMNDHVTKPIDPDQLFSTLLKWIKPAAERAVVQEPPVLDAPPEPDQAVPVEDELPESLPGFDLAAGLSRLMGNNCFTVNCCLILGQTMVESLTKSVRHWQPGILSRPTV
jgi:CheY-like chemotaxis protein